MRDYKQMQEIQKLKEQAAADTSQHDGNRDESEKYTKRNPGFKGWLEYIVEYYKWPILLGTAVVIGLLVGAVQMSNNANPDLTIEPTKLGYLAGLYGGAAIAVTRTESPLR